MKWLKENKDGFKLLGCFVAGFAVYGLYLLAHKLDKKLIAFTNGDKS